MINKINNYIKPYKIFRDMRKNLWLKTSELQVLQWEKFKILLNHAYQNVSFYRRLFDSVGVKPEDIKGADDLYKIPTITKSQIKNDKKDMIARNTNLKGCIEYKTSGSTGNNLSGYLRKDDALYVRGSYERVRNDNGFRMLRDKIIILGSPFIIPDKKEWYQYLGIRRIEGLNVFEPLGIQLEKLKKAKPDALWGYPSAIKLLAKVIQEKRIKEISPRLIFTFAEVLDSETRDFVNRIFNVELFDVYGAWETACMAWECSEHSGYHVNMDVVLMEFVDEDGYRVSSGERGRVVVTNLHSFAMPIIRYEIGDFAIPTYKECVCGRGGYLLKKIEGRYDDFIRLKENKLIAPPILWSIMKSISGVSEFQIVQEKEDKIVVYVVRVEGFGDTMIVEEIDKEFKKVFGDNVYVSTKFVESIARAKSGKLRSVISKL
jgi:phenylacetate-CoA ligase